MFDHDDLHVGSRKPGQALVRIEQERWRAAAEDFVGMGIERDDSRASVPLPGLANQVPEDRLMAAVEPVEDADGQGETTDRSVERVNTPSYPESHG
jgi:hypothetical protein